VLSKLLIIIEYMTTYTIQIDEQNPLGQSIIALLKSVQDVVPSVVKKREKHKLTYEEIVNKSDLHRRLDTAFHDVKLMLDGKKPEKTLDELIYELQNNND